MRHEPSPGKPSPALLRAARWLTPLVSLAFRPRLDGLEHLPERGPFMIVANHSGGLAIAEIVAFAARYLERFGNARPLAGFAHEKGFRIPVLSTVLAHVGAVPSTYAAAEEALARGVPLLVFPGGDHEAFRPIWQASRVDFGGRKGFLKIAKRAGVPIVPMGIRGSHYTVPILWRSRWVLPYALVVPRLIGVKRWPVTLLTVVIVTAIATGLDLAWYLRLLLSWLFAVSALSFTPIVPATIRMRIGAPLSGEALFTEDDADLDRALATVEGAVQALVTPR